MSSVDAWRFVEASDVNQLHDDALTKYGGMPGFRDINCPEAKIAATKNAVFYETPEDEEPDILRAAAHLLVYFATGHCYTDGNKLPRGSPCYGSLTSTGSVCGEMIPRQLRWSNES